MMSKANDWARRKIKNCEAYETDDASAYVMTDRDGFPVLVFGGACQFSANEALVLARWILDTFGEA